MVFTGVYRQLFFFFLFLNSFLIYVVVLQSKTVYTGDESSSVVFNVKRATLLIIESSLQPVCLGNTVSGPNRPAAGRVCVSVYERAITP